PTNENIEGVTKDVVAAAATLGVQIDIVRASDSREIEAAFATLVRNKVNALLIGPDVFFSGRRGQLSTFTARHPIPAVSKFDDFARGRLGPGPLSMELASELRMSNVVQLRAAITPRGFVLPKHLNSMSSDAGNRARSPGRYRVFKHDVRSYSTVHQ